MCVPALITALGPILGGAGFTAATAAGGTALATAQAGVLASLGTIAGVGGSIIQGVQGMATANAQAKAINAQAQTEATLTATQDTRQRAQMASQIAQQRAELAARGVQLDSVTSIALGMTAAKELSFQSQATRSDGQARQTELSAAARQAKAMGVNSLLKGFTSAAGSVLDKAPDLWPGFFKDAKPTLAGG